MTPSISQLLLLLSALYVAGRSYPRGGEHNSNAYVISLAAAFVAAASAGQLLLGGSQDAQTLQRMLDNLAYFAAMPLLACALVAAAWRQNWSRAAWGRGLLALFALFELCRRSEVGETYSLALAALSALTMLCACLRLPATARFTAAAAAAALALATLALGEQSLLPQLQTPALAPLALAGSLLLLQQAESKSAP